MHRGADDRPSLIRALQAKAPPTRLYLSIADPRCPPRGPRAVGARRVAGDFDVATVEREVLRGQTSEGLRQRIAIHRGPHSMRAGRVQVVVRAFVAPQHVEHEALLVGC